MTQRRRCNGGRRYTEEEYPHQELTGRVISVFHEVYRRMGHGFLELPHRKALAIELDFTGIASAREVAFELTYRGVPVGTCKADLVVESTVVVEVQAGARFDATAPTQLLNYLKASGLSLGLVLHFGPEADVRRIIAGRGEAERLG